MWARTITLEWPDLLLRLARGEQLPTNERKRTLQGWTPQERLKWYRLYWPNQEK